MLLLVAFALPSSALVPPRSTARYELCGRATVFDLLADERILVDPSGGTCCRNECASCSYHEATADGVAYQHEELVDGRWLPVASYVDVPPLWQVATWANVLFPKGLTTDRAAFDAALTGADDVDGAWRALTLAPATLTRAEVSSRLAQLAGAKPAVDEAAFNAAVAAAAAAPPAPVVDYEAMDLDQLRALCEDRGIRRPPRVKGAVIQELRFFDAAGRPGKRSPSTRRLEYPY